MLVDVDSDGYAAATRPHNSSIKQRPARVAVVSRPEDIAPTLDEVAALAQSSGTPLEIVPQATGHGAGAPVGKGSVLLDTSRLTDVSIDPESRVAVVGAGATWSAVNAAAERHGLLGLAGSAPSVSVSGYTFGGGIGLEFDLVPAADLHAGALLWHADALPKLIAAWSSTIGTVGSGVSSSIAVLHVPPLPPFPEELHGRVAVHLAIADPDGPVAATPLLDAMRAAAEPVSDSWGPTDAAGLARIHLDPPTATPAIGDARWLDASTPDIAEALLSTAAAADAPIVMMEIRHVAGAPVRRTGAVVAPPGDFIYHAVAPLSLFPRERIEAGFARARSVWSIADAGSTPGSWVEGAAGVPDALPADVRKRSRRSPTP